MIALSMEDSGNSNKICNVALAVDGRRRLCEGDGEERKVNDFTLWQCFIDPFRRKKITGIEGDVIVRNSYRDSPVLADIDWVEERRSQPLIARAFASGEMAVMISSGKRFQFMDKMDFGWGKVAFGSCHVPSSRKDCYIMTLPSPTKNDDWVVYMHMAMKMMNYIEKHASHMFKPMTTDYLQI